MHADHSFVFLPSDAPDWLRTVDFTPNQAFGSCLAYRLVLDPTAADELLEVLTMFSLVEPGLNWRAEPQVPVTTDWAGRKQDEWLAGALNGMAPKVARRLHAAVSRGLWFPEQCDEALLRLCRGQAEAKLVAGLDQLLRLGGPTGAGPLADVKKMMAAAEELADNQRKLPDYCARVGTRPQKAACTQSKHWCQHAAS